MTDWDKLKADTEDFFRNMFDQAKAEAPALEDTVEAALVTAGAPADVAAALKSIVSSLVAHFEADKAAAAQPEPEPGQPQA